MPRKTHLLPKNLRALKAQAKIYCNFIFDIKFFWLFYTGDKQARAEDPPPENFFPLEKFLSPLN